MPLNDACRKSLTKDYKKLPKINEAQPGQGAPRTTKRLQNDYQRLPKTKMMTDDIISCLQEKSY